MKARKSVLFGLCGSLAVIAVWASMNRGAAHAQTARPPRWTSFEILQTNTGTNGARTETSLRVEANGRARSDSGPAPWATPAQRTRMLGLLRNPAFWAGMREGFHCPAATGTLHVVFTMTTVSEALTQDVSGCVTATDNNIAKQIFETQP